MEGNSYTQSVRSFSVLANCTIACDSDFQNVSSPNYQIKANLPQNATKIVKFLK